MKTLILAGAAMTLSAIAFAAPGDKTPAKIHCAVMNSDEVDVAAATKSKMFADYKGRRYFFCCAGCPAAFKKDPAKYAKSESIPTPKAPAKKKA